MDKPRLNSPKEFNGASIFHPQITPVPSAGLSRLSTGSYGAPIAGSTLRFDRRRLPQRNRFHISQGRHRFKK